MTKHVYYALWLGSDPARPVFYYAVSKDNAPAEACDERYVTQTATISISILRERIRRWHGVSDQWVDISELVRAARAQTMRRQRAARRARDDLAPVGTRSQRAVAGHVVRRARATVQATDYMTDRINELRARKQEVEASKG